MSTTTRSTGTDFEHPSHFGKFFRTTTRSIFREELSFLTGEEDVCDEVLLYGPTVAERDPHAMSVASWQRTLRAGLFQVTVRPSSGRGFSSPPEAACPLPA